MILNNLSHLPDNTKKATEREIEIIEGENFNQPSGSS